MGNPDDTPIRDLFPDRPPGPPVVPPAAQANPPRHYYSVDRARVYSLRDAARALEMPEGNLRRAILLDQLRAVEVDDDRQYLLDGAALQEFVRRLRPAEACAFPEPDSLLPDLLTFLIIPILIVLVLLFVRSPEGARQNAPAPQRPAPAVAAPEEETGPTLEALPPAPSPASDRAAPAPLEVPNY